MTAAANVCEVKIEEPKTHEVLPTCLRCWREVPHIACFKPLTMLLKITFMQLHVFA